MTLEQQLETDSVQPLPPGLSEAVLLGTGIADGYHLYPSAIGEVAVAFNPNGVSFVGLIGDGFVDRFTATFGRPLLPAQPPRQWEDRIATALEAGTPGRLPVDLRGTTPFQSAVLGATSSIPKGEARPYGWLAQQVGSPGAVRAVGSALARNPVPLIIPCHRVVRSDGMIGNYSLVGPEVKRALLEVEGAQPDQLEALAGRGIKIQGNRSTGVYCYPTCRALRRSKPENVVGFSSSARATDSGYRPCQVCRPI